jgi:hypothetical protein
LDVQEKVTIEKLMQVAQDVVDDWRADENRPSFSQYLSAHDPARCPWPCLELTDEERKTFMILAEAIRTGRGHAYTNPEPLLELVGESMVADCIVT